MNSMNSMNSNTTTQPAPIVTLRSSSVPRKDKGEYFFYHLKQPDENGQPMNRPDRDWVVARTAACHLVTGRKSSPRCENKQGWEDVANLMSRAGFPVIIEETVGFYL